MSMKPRTVCFVMKPLADRLMFVLRPRERRAASLGVVVSASTLVDVFSL